MLDRRETAKGPLGHQLSSVAWFSIIEPFKKFISNVRFNEKYGRSDLSFYLGFQTNKLKTLLFINSKTKAKLYEILGSGGIRTHAIDMTGA